MPVKNSGIPSGPEAFRGCISKITCLISSSDGTLANSSLSASSMHGSMSPSRSGENLGFSDIYSYLKLFSKYSPISFLLRSRTPLSNIISFIRFLLLQIMVDKLKKKNWNFDHLLVTTIL